MASTSQSGGLMVENALTAQDAMELLGQVQFGRIVFTTRAMPAAGPGPSPWTPRPAVTGICCR